MTLLGSRVPDVELAGVVASGLDPGAGVGVGWSLVATMGMWLSVAAWAIFFFFDKEYTRSSLGTYDT